MLHDASDHVMTEEMHDHDRGLAFDLSRLIGRRRLLTLLGGSGLAVIAAGCASDDAPAAQSAAAPTTTSAAATPATPATSSASPLEAVPDETAGPFPGDGSNGVNVLTESGVVRSDIRSSFGPSSTVAKGIPTTLTFTLVDASGGAPLSGAAVYVWHCDATGLYSLYSNGATDENYLRGVQAADADGNVTFTTIYPGCYSGRWPHIHYEVYPTLGDATSGSNLLATSQLALTEEASAAVYATADYPGSTANLGRVSLASDNVFADGAELETPTITGSVTDGLTVTMRAAVTT